MKNYIIFAVVALVVIIGAIMYKSSMQSEPVESADDSSNIIIDDSRHDVGLDMLKIEDIKVGTGDEAKKGSLISVHYVGTLDDGTKFDRSRDRGEPFQFPLGQGMVIQGWEQGFEGMKVGGIRNLTIPPELGYGAQGAGGSIPPNATLHFEVELLSVRYN